MRLLTVSSFGQAQDLIRQIYGETNDVVYPNAQDLLIKASLYSTRLLEKGIRASNSAEIKRSTVMTFSWLLAFANRMRITDLHSHLYQHFLCCPYCKEKPCTCDKAKGTRSVFEVASFHGWESIDTFQKHTSELYPKNKLVDAGTHLASETSELLEAWITSCRWSGSEKVTNRVMEEFCDVIAHLMAVSHGSFFNLSEAFTGRFIYGCPGCEKSQCVCGYGETANSKILVQVV